MIVIERSTRETTINLQFVSKTTDGPLIETPVPFFSHMLEALCLHGQLYIGGTAGGDVDVDPHHLIEDVGICLGKAVRQHQDDVNIDRSGFFIFPMDGSLAQVAIDLCGRSHLIWNVALKGDHSTSFGLAVFREFFAGFCQGARATVHINVPYLDCDHHAVEAIFKSFGKALHSAVKARGSSGVSSSKGVIDD